MRILSLGWKNNILIKIKKKSVRVKSLTQLKVIVYER